MKNQKIAVTTINTIGGGGYVFCLLQWLWAAMLFLPGLLKAGFMKQFIQAPPPPSPVVSQPDGVSTVSIIFIAVVVIVMVILTIYICIKIPATIGKTGSKITHQATDIALPIVTRHKKMALKKQLRLTARLLFLTKMAFCILPFGLILLTDNADNNLSRNVVIIIGAFTAVCALTLFSLQAGVAKLLRVDYKQVW